MATKAKQIDFLLSQVRNSVGSLNGGTITFYNAGAGTTLKTIWLDRDKATPAANPYTLDADGTAHLYADGSYKVLIKNAAGSLIYTRDNLFFNYYDNLYEIDALDTYGSGTSFTKATIDAALVVIGGGGATKYTLLLRPGTWVMNADADYSAHTNVMFKIVPGAILQIANGTTTTIPNMDDTGLHKRFDYVGTGQVTFAAGSVKEVYPEWWTTNTTPGTTDMTTAIQYAINSLTTKEGKVRCSTGTYLLSTVITLKNGITIQGEGYKVVPNVAFGNAQWVAAGAVTGTVFKVSSTNNAFQTSGNPAVTVNGVRLRDLAVLGPGSGTSIGLDLGNNAQPVVHFDMDDIGFFNWYTGIKLQNFVSNHDLRNIKVRGDTIGIDFNTGGLSTDDHFYGLNVEVCTTGIRFQKATGIHFYGGLFQSNTTGIDFAVTQAGTEHISFDGFWFEGDTTPWTYSWTIAGQGITNISFSHCRIGVTWTWTIPDGGVVNDFLILDCDAGGLTADFSALTTGGYCMNWNIINSKLGNIVGFDSSYLRNLNFIGSLLIGVGGTLITSITSPLYQANISGVVTPDFRNGQLQELTLTGNVTTFNAPSNMQNGAEITFIFVQGGIGGYTIVFAGYSKPTWDETGNIIGKISTVVFKKRYQTPYQIAPQVVYY